MTKLNTRKSILEKGGMMVEALAMLGLMAVVTPTMYKKSAERTLEVEDINTATTVRTYMSAANALMSSNYVTIISDMEETGQEVKTIDIAGGELDAFLPYNFQVDNALYEYNTPKVSIVRNGTNLTAFALFPAKGGEDDGIGQERTARIASLVGASGGYVRGPNSARGVGGIWTLSGADYSKVFPSDNSPVYSLVASTSNAVNGSSMGNADLDNSKYLQRTYEGDDDKWRNTMRTDLYMGGYNDGDEHPIDTPEGAPRHSIRSVDSMIIGAETLPSGVNNVGLYISKDVANKNTVLGGTLSAAAEEFFVGDGNLKFAKKSGSKALKSDGGYLFQVTSGGDLAQYGNISLAEGFASDAYNGEINLGVGSDANKDFALKATHTQGGATDLSLIRDNMFKMNTVGDETVKTAVENSATAANIVMMNGGYHSVNKGASKVALSEISYNNRQAFPIIMGANTRVRGLLAADQVDTQTLRTATLKTGSEKVDDQYQWLNVDKNGVKMYGIERRGDGNAKVAMEVYNHGFKMRAGGDGTDDKMDPNAATLAVVNYGDNYSSYVEATATDIYIRAKNDGGRVQIGNNKLTEKIYGGEFDFDTVDGDSSEFRVRIGQNGNLDLDGANFNIFNKSGNSVIAIAGNDRYCDGSYVDTMVNGARDDAHYDMAVHGKTVFTEQGDNPYKYMAIGHHDTDAGINIDNSNTSGDKDDNVVYVDLSHRSETYQIQPVWDGYSSFSEYGKKMEPGTVYIRKGLVDIMPKQPDSDIGGSSTLHAKTANGSIQASRFVANNMDSSGSAVVVPNMITDSTFTTYNGSGKNRYDTYMVNPAYTSVMHDIKLTTRGGARLSDVLPDFITKGIYIATNTNDDNISKFEFSIGSGGVYINGHSATQAGMDWASPYTGSVPTPQCPPGYSRVVTVNPTSMHMAQAGNVIKTSQTNGSKYMVEEALMATTEAATAMKESDSNLKNKILPQYRELTIGDTYSDGGYQGRFTFSGYSDDFVVDDMKNFTAKAKTSDGTPIRYVLTAESTNNTLKPFVFQQNTWLKSLVVPICKSKSTVFGDNCGSEYTRAWAVLVGFIYDTGIYDEYLSTSGTKSVDRSNYLAWNVFPVEKNSLEATVTTYCYFNRNNDALEVSAKAFDDSTYDKYVDKYHPLERISSDFKKDGDSKYLNRLNDPNLKYNEVW
ncbi:MAG: hypothetical protein VZR95_02135 [Alphaproteobacteria bacterium]